MSSRDNIRMEILTIIDIEGGMMTLRAAAERDQEFHSVLWEMIDNGELRLSPEREVVVP